MLDTWAKTSDAFSAGEGDGWKDDTMILPLTTLAPSRTSVEQPRRKGLPIDSVTGVGSSYARRGDKRGIDDLHSACRNTIR